MRTARANYKPRQRPDPGVCPARPLTGLDRFFGVKGKHHDWRYSSSWNGNDRRVLPWWKGTSGIGRGGWRCYCCGEMRWDERDEDYERSMAYHLPGALPRYAHRLEMTMISIPENWFIYGMGEQVKPIIYKGDTHERCKPFGFWAELQHRRGGLLTKGVGETMTHALQSALDVLPLERAKEVYGDDA